MADRSDRWAGYTVNPDDAAVLREKVKTLGSADRPADVRGGMPEAGEEYRGLRVVME